MKRYFSMENFREALLLGAAMTLLSSPRIFSSGIFPAFYVLPTFALLTLVAAAVTAWGKSAGMKGPFPQPKVILKGLLWVLLLLIILVPIKFFWFIPLFYSAIESTGDIRALRLIFPENFLTAIALTLWVMGFEILFFQAAAMSFFAKLTKHLPLALLLSTLLRFYVTWLRLADMGVKGDEPIILSHAVLMNLLSCLLFMRYGLLPPMLFIGALSICRWTFLWP